MQGFTQLYAALDETTKTNQKLKALVDYLEQATPSDAAWAIYFLSGRKPKQLVQIPKLIKWAIDAAGIPAWLFNESYDSVGDIAETIALLLAAPASSTNLSLTTWIEERLLPLRILSEEQQRESILRSWSELNEEQRYIFNKLLTGAFRVGVSQQLVIRAVASYAQLESSVIAHRMMGNWEPSGRFYETLISGNIVDTDPSRPYPFMLAHSLDGEPEELGPISQWQAEWKWDGIRAQLIRRQGNTFIWSRGEELVSDRYPELLAAASALPDGTVLDGEILCWRQGQVMPFSLLQQRIGRKTLTGKVLAELPVVLLAYDLLELNSKDLRHLTLRERRRELTELINTAAQLPVPTPAPEKISAVSRQLLLPFLSATGGDSSQSSFNEPEYPIKISPVLQEESWLRLRQKRETASQEKTEGLMLKQLNSPYRVGRQRGDWWKWKINPYTIDAVLISAQAGSGKRANLYTDYTFAVWDKNTLVPIAKAYSGLTDQEIQEVDKIIRKNTVEKFGPVRSVKPDLVFELAFERIQESNRHKSGVAVRFPRIARWRRDKPAAEADSLEHLKSMLTAQPR